MRSLFGLLLLEESELDEIHGAALGGTEWAMFRWVDFQWRKCNWKAIGGSAADSREMPAKPWHADSNVKQRKSFLPVPFQQWMGCAVVVLSCLSSCLVAGVWAWVWCSRTAMLCSSCDLLAHCFPRITPFCPPFSPKLQTGTWTTLNPSTQTDPADLTKPLGLTVFGSHLTVRLLALTKSLTEGQGSSATVKGEQALRQNRTKSRITRSVRYHGYVS